MLTRSSYKHLAFTGSKDHITLKQLTVLHQTFRSLRDKGYLWMHNGDCITSDFEAAKVWGKLKGKVMLHPPVNSKYRAFFQADIICEPREYIVRDHHMVDLSRRLIATPQTFEEQIRSGTWATIRYARKLRLKITIIYPDGSVVND